MDSGGCSSCIVGSFESDGEHLAPTVSALLCNSVWSGEFIQPPLSFQCWQEKLRRENGLDGVEAGCLPRTPLQHLRPRM